MRIESLIALGALSVVGAASNATADVRQPDAEVLFAFDKYEITSNGIVALSTIAERARDTPGTKIVIDAHADARGTETYNVTLTLRRATAVRDFFTAHGVGADRIIFAAYGEDGPRRATFAQDRRASVLLTAEPLWAIVDGSKPFATTVIWNEPVTLAEIQGPPDKIPQTARR